MSKAAVLSNFFDLLRYKCPYSGTGNILALNIVTNYGYKKERRCSLEFLQATM